MRVCYVAEYGNRVAGSEQSLLNVIACEKEFGVDPVILFYRDWEFVQVAWEQGIQTAVINGKNPVAEKNISLYRKFKSKLRHPYNVLHIGQACRFLQDNKIELVHLNSVLCCPTVAYAARRLGISYIWHIREFLDEDHDQRFVEEKKMLHLMGEADRVVAISDAVRRKWEPLLGRKVQLIYNGLPKEQYFFQRSDLLCSSLVRMVIVGRIVEGKGQMDAVLAIEQLTKLGHRNFRLTIVGYRDAGVYEKDLYEYVKSHGLEQCISVQEFTYDLQGIRKDHDIGLVTSRAEAFGRVTIENMLAGLLAVGTNSGGTPELITDGVTGFLYEPGDVQSLCRVLLMIEERKEEMRKVAEAGQKYAEKNFLIENTAKKIYKMYQDVNNAGGGIPNT